MIKNDAILNEELDPKLVSLHVYIIFILYSLPPLFVYHSNHFWTCRVFFQMIAKLKREIQLLKDELALAKGEQYESEVTEDEQERLVNFHLI